MVSIRSTHQSESADFTSWLSELALAESTKKKLLNVVNYSHNVPMAQEMVEILQQLHMDDETLTAAFVLPYCEEQELEHESMLQEYGAEVATLVTSVRKMQAINTIKSTYPSDNAQQIERLRNMMLSMVEDVRAVVVKMAERICTLHSIKQEDEEARVLVAKECATIYAPLANRLGIGQLKWELEDLSFRYLHPVSYKKIAGMLNEKRRDREQYITDVVEQLQTLLNKEGINAQVIGRPKHIFSIYKKMQKKALGFDQLFDIRALRIVADRLQDCYAALGTVHANFKHIASEFDDYIATPKPNGYQSIHTVIVGPQGKSIEIQIRTEQMHQDAELGVAAHWKYKEGSAGKKASADERVNWLRKILQWQEELVDSGNLLEEFKSQVFEDRVYVLTPVGDVVDLPFGATPLDFAYYVHSNVGHRCSGAKVNGRIVPFTYTLQNGDQVEILTSKTPSPKRDWMHPGLGYVHSARARATIQSFFKKQDKDKNTEAGKELLERELSKVNVELKHAAEVYQKYNVKSVEDLYAAIGAGDVRIMAVVRYLEQKYAPVLPEPTPKPIKTRASKKSSGSEPIIAEGVGNLLSQLAKCCKPVAGEAILGYITQGKGVSVHKKDCTQLRNLLQQHPEREIEVAWAYQQELSFQAELDLYCFDRTGLLKDITAVLSNEKVPVMGVQSASDKRQGTAVIHVIIEVRDAASLSKTIDKLKQIPDIQDIARR